MILITYFDYGDFINKFVRKYNLRFLLWSDVGEYICEYRLRRGGYFYIALHFTNDNRLHRYNEMKRNDKLYEYCICICSAYIVSIIEWPIGFIKFNDILKKCQLDDIRGIKAIKSFLYAIQDYEDRYGLI